MNICDRLVLGSLWDIEVIFKLEGPLSKGPVFLGGVGKPGLTCFIIHGSEGFEHNWVSC